MKETRKTRDKTKRKKKEYKRRRKYVRIQTKEAEKSGGKGEKERILKRKS